MPDRIKVTMAGIGKNGLPIARALAANPGIEVVSILCGDKHDGHGIDLGNGQIMGATSSLTDALLPGPQVLVEFTHHMIAPEIIARVFDHGGIDVVSGTSNMDPDDLLSLGESLAGTNTCLFYIPSAAIAMVLHEMFAAWTAAFMPKAEISEFHHDMKADAPSGVATRTARKIAAVRAKAPATPGRETEIHGGEGARGAIIDGVHVHSGRIEGLFARQSVLNGAPGQILESRYDIIDPGAAYGPGVIDAVYAAVEMSGLVNGLETLYTDRIRGLIG